MFAVRAERALLASLGGGCQVPIGAHGVIAQDELELSACVAALDGRTVIRGVHTGSTEDPEAIGKELASTLLASGGKEILDEVFRLESQDANVSAHPEA